jgi:branched-chain amino acid transport system permease protein
VSIDTAASPAVGPDPRWDDPGGGPEAGSPRSLPNGGTVALVLAGVAALVALWFVGDARLPRGLPAGILARGAVFGSLYALNAIGLVLVYKANRVVNFAQAEFGSVAAVLAIVFVVQWGWNFFAAFGAGLVMAIVLGAIVESVIIRRFSKAPRLILAVATIALAQVLAGVAMIIPLLFDGRGSGSFSIPIDARFTVFPVIFNANYLLAIVTVPLVVAALVAFLRWTDYGTAIRAAADNSDRAGLLGIPVPMLSTVVWSVAALLSALAVLLRTPMLGFTSFGSVSGAGASMLLFTLAAAVLGRMESLPRAAIAAVLLGIFQEVAIWSWSNTTIVDASLILLILGALLLQKDVFSRAAETGISTWRAMREVRPVPTELRRLPEVRVGFGVVKLALLAFATALPLFASPSQVGAASLVLIYAMVAVSLFVLTGWGGHISLGQFALVGFGGATTSVLYGRHDWDILLATLAGVIVAGLVALVLGLPALRIRGPFLAVTTLAFAVTSSTYFLQRRYVPWFIERRIERPQLFGSVSLSSDRAVYYLALVCLVLVLVGVAGVRNSRTGRAIIAVRDNELAAQAVSIHAARLKLTAFALSGGIAGFAGAVYVVHQKGLHGDAFAPEVSLLLFSMVVIGGLGSLPGAVMGAVYIRGAEFFLPAGWSLIASGVGILALLLLLPEGLGGLLNDTRDRYLRWVARRRGIAVASLEGQGASKAEAPTLADDADGLEGVSATAAPAPSTTGGTT